MPHLKIAFAAACLTAALGLPAYADSNSTSIKNCEAAISERLDLESTPVSYDLKDVHTTMQYRDYTFNVSAAPSVNDLEVTCRARKTASVRSLTFDESALPVSVATK